MPDTPAGWFPVLTALLGYAAGFVSEWFRDQRTSKRDREARKATRQDQLSERRVTFQRQTLLDLQDAMMKLVRTAGVMHHQDIMEYHKTGKWQQQSFGGEVAESSRLTMASTLMLSVRVRDDTIRELVEKVKSHALKAMLCTTEGESQIAMRNMTNTYETLNERIGEVFRKLDDEPVPS
ncbi:MAG: hypothetical protein ACYDBV_04770 [Nitrospiria bacterium]